MAGEASSSTVVGGFQIKALVGPGFQGAVYQISIPGTGLTQPAFSAADIVSAAFQARSRAGAQALGRGLDDQSLINWVNSGGAQQLERQAQDLAGGAPNSAGETGAAAAQARDDGANTQNPAPAETVQQDGNAEPAPAVTAPSNAQTSVTDTPEATTPPPTIPGGTKPNAAVSAPTTSPARISNSGLIEPGRQSQATQSFIYKAISVISVFDRGRFTQELEGRLLIFPIPPVTTSAVAQVAGSNADRNRATEVDDAFSRAPDQTDAETRRLQAQSNAARFGSRALADRQAQAAITLREARAGRAFTPGTAGAITPLTSTPPNSNGQGVALRNQNIASGVESGSPDKNTQQGNKEY